jgi:hypothetical protein
MTPHAVFFLQKAAVFPNFSRFQLSNFSRFQKAHQIWEANSSLIVNVKISGEKRLKIFKSADSL